MTLAQAEFIIKVVISGRVPTRWNCWVGPLYRRAANLIVNWHLMNH